MKSNPWRSASFGKAAASVGLLLLLLGGTAQAQSPSVLQSVRIDMSGLRGGPPEVREQLQVCLSREVPRAFSGRIVPSQRSAPVLVARPLSVFLASAAGGSAGFFEPNMSQLSTDSLEGEGIVSGRRIPVTVSANPGGGAFTQLGFTARLRIDALCQSFALWLSRRV